MQLLKNKIESTPFGEELCLEDCRKEESVGGERGSPVIGAGEKTEGGERPARPWCWDEMFCWRDLLLRLCGLRVKKSLSRQSSIVFLARQNKRPCSTF